MIEAPEIPVAHEPLPENETFQADQPLLKDLPQQSVSSIIESIEIKHWQLKVLLHAKHCDKQQKCFYNGDCKTMKDVLNHMKTCSDEDQSCKVDFCISSRDVLLHKKNCIDSDCPICPPPLQTTISLEKSATGQKTLPTSETGAAAAADPQPGTSSENAAGASSSSSDVEDCGRMEPWVSLPDDRYDICVEMNTENIFNVVLSLRLGLDPERLHGEKGYFSQNIKKIQAAALDTLRHFEATQNIFRYPDKLTVEPYNRFCVIDTITQFYLEDRILGGEDILIGLSLFQKQQTFTLISFLCHLAESKSCIKKECTRHPNCTYMKIDFDHVVACKKGYSCDRSDCPPTRLLIDHWKNCKDYYCQVCNFADCTIS